MKTRAEVFRIAADLNIEETAPTTMKEVSDILFRYAGPCSSAEEMFDRANYYLKRTAPLLPEYVRLAGGRSLRLRSSARILQGRLPLGRL